ncbi:hypothetical protein COJ96_10650 [Bacillus sp. AFS073361]|uniref:hypothetical protein n=1 Tax=Bacillus sp. AFS073361 TaxID=2033511 RepID=UPI000BF3BA59|nr:hypothetical protein [Bacillus sp. AFS073361]PFP29355.1 hypothetical protein COJ96_10650 [Bacillus sp. AFS073361]
MGIERTLQVGKTKIDVFLDRNLHLFDKDLPGTMTITNAMSDHYLKEVMGWIGDYRYNRVFLYHTDGLVSEWDNNRFQFVDQDEPELYFWFKAARMPEQTLVH